MAENSNYQTTNLTRISSLIQIEETITFPKLSFLIKFENTLYKPSKIRIHSQYTLVSWCL